MIEVYIIKKRNQNRMIIDQKIHDSMMNPITHKKPNNIIYFTCHHTKLWIQLYKWGVFR